MLGRKAIGFAAALTAIIVAVIWGLQASRPASDDATLFEARVGLPASEPPPEIEGGVSTSRSIVRTPFVDQSASRPGFRRVSIVARYDSGVPLADLQVALGVDEEHCVDHYNDAYLAWERSPTAPVVRLDAEGRCAFDVPLGVALKVSFHSEESDLRRNDYSYPDVGRIGAAQTNAEIVIAENLLRVTVVDVAGRPVIGRRFSAQSMADGAQVFHVVDTDARGVIEFRGLSSGGVWLRDCDRTEVVEAVKRRGAQLLPDVMSRRDSTRAFDYTLAAASAGGRPLECEEEGVDLTAPSDVRLTLQPISLTTLRVLDAARRPIADVRVAVAVKVDGFEFEFPIAKGVTDHDGTAWNALPCDGNQFGRSAKLSSVIWTIRPPDGSDAIVVTGRPGAVGELVDCGDVVLATGRRWRFVIIDDDPPMRKTRSGRRDEPESYREAEERTPEDDGTVVVYPRPGDDVALVEASYRYVVPILPAALQDDGPGQLVRLADLTGLPRTEYRELPPRPEEFPLTFKIFGEDGRPAEDAEVEIRSRHPDALLEHFTYRKARSKIDLPPIALQFIVTTEAGHRTSHEFLHSSESRECVIHLPKTRLLRVKLVAPRDAVDWADDSPWITATVADVAGPIALRQVRKAEEETSGGSTPFGHHEADDVAVFRADRTATIVAEADYGGRRYRAVAPPDVDALTIRIEEGAVAVAVSMPPFPFCVSPALTIIDELGRSHSVGCHEDIIVGESWSIPSILLYPGRYRASYKATASLATGDPSVVREASFVVEPGRPMTVTLPR